MTEKKLPSYPSIFALGHRALADLFADPVIVQEKADGSQFSFGRIPGDGGLSDGEGNSFFCRSKGKDQTPPNTDKMFLLAVEQVKDLDLVPGWVYRGEYLSKPKHNALAYGRIPARNIILFDIEIGEQSFLGPEAVAAEALRLGMECVPTLYTGTVDDWEQLKLLLQRESVLGGVLIEGVVVKNYERFGIDKKVLMGKYVSEAFKEVHAGEWRKANPQGKDIIGQLVEAYQTPARWQKAVQHLREDGLLTDSPKDIGPLIGAISKDIHDEEADAIKEVLFKWAWATISRRVTAGFADWYKEQLAQAQFEPKESE